MKTVMIHCPLEFTCEHCGRTFHDLATTPELMNERREGEYQETYGTAATDDEVMIVCDDCDEWLMAEAAKRGYLNPDGSFKSEQEIIAIDALAAEERNDNN